MNSIKARFTPSPSKPTTPLILNPNPNFQRWSLEFRTCKTKPISSSSSKILLPVAQASSSSSLMASGVGPTGFQGPLLDTQSPEEAVEKAIYRCRFMTLLGVFGALMGSLLCFIEGCNAVAASFIEQYARSGKVMVLLVEALDVYLLGTVMLVFGMGLYELFVCNLDIAKSLSKEEHPHRSNLFGLFTLMERPKWLEIKTVNELKTKVGHVIVMLLLIGLFDKCKKAAIHSPLDLLCFSASVLLCSGCLFLLSKLNGSK